MKKLLSSYLLLSAVLLSGCYKTIDPEDVPENLTEEEVAERTSINTFAYNVMSQYYLWNEEISGAMNSWSPGDNPVEKVLEIRYKDENGKDIDRWTEVTDDYSGMVSSSTHVSTTYGMDFKLYYSDASKKAVYMVTTLVYPASPASKTGISRGCCFTKINGKEITAKNYVELVNDEFLSSASVRLTDINGSEISMTAVEMYEDPVLVHKIFEVDGTPVGYLFYNGFTLDSINGLVSAASDFKSAGVKELILDLRYNLGGYVLTETALASLLAPESEVRAGSIFETNIYNKGIAKVLGDSNTYFTPSISDEINGLKIEADLISSNLNLSKLYAIMTESSASASESLITGLKPYTDIKIFGSKSHGKFCTGMMLSAKDWYEGIDKSKNKEIAGYEKYAADWGIYVMIGRFADKNGKTPCMPDGFEPDFQVEDNPTEAYQLGDENEAMLKAVLSYIKTGSVNSTRAGGTMLTELPAVNGNACGRRIMTVEKGKLLH